MRGSLIRRFTREEHNAILKQHERNAAAAKAYTALDRGEVSPQLVRYWREVFVEHNGNMSGADRALAQQRMFIKPQPDDDIGSALSIPQIANRIMIVGDLHAPYHHQDSLEFLKSVRDQLQPDLVVIMGDEADYHAMSFHDSDPNLDSAGTELEKAKRFLSKLHREFPNALICHSNHGSMQYRRAKAFGIPVQMIKRYRDVLLPGIDSSGWSWAHMWRVETPHGPVLFKHQSSGPVLSDAAHEGASVVAGHLHGKFSIEYAASSDRLYFGMQVGCLIDKDALAFAYGKHAKLKPIIGCGCIVDGVPGLVPMLLGPDGRWEGV